MRVLLIVCVLSVLGVAGSSSASAAGFSTAGHKKCGYASPGAGDTSAYTWARKVGCGTARKLARDLQFRRSNGGTLYGVLIQYRCKTRTYRDGDQSYRGTRCRKGDKSILVQTL